jgi:hypothetical protein
VLDDIKENTLHIQKYGADHKLNFERAYKRDKAFDPTKDFSFIHDCNAAWITVKQGEKVYKMDVIESVA